MPKRIQRKRTKGWRMPPNTVYVGRPTIWGNPFDGADAVEKYREALSEWPVSAKTMLERKKTYDGNIMIWITTWVRPIVHELRGKDLACWCPLDKPCHADVLLEIANKGD